MKKFLLGLATLVLFASCSQNETIEVSKGNAIEFQNAFVDNATRSNVDPSTTTANLQDFAVYGFMDEYTGKVFIDELVSAPSWTYSNTQYWTPNVYYFAALAPGNNSRQWTLEAANTDATAKRGIGVVSFTNDGTQDLLYWADVFDNTAGACQNNKVGITFNHLLSKVKFSFKNEFKNNNASIIVKDIQITNARTKGEIDLTSANWWSTPCWTFTNDTRATFAFGDANSVYNGTSYDKVQDLGLQIPMNAEKESDKELLLFPETDAIINVTFTVELYFGNQKAIGKTHNVSVTTTLNMGYCYDFKATLNSDNVDPDNQLKPIEFTVTAIKDWAQGGEVGVDVSNSTTQP